MEGCIPVRNWFFYCGLPPPTAGGCFCFERVQLKGAFAIRLSEVRMQTNTTNVARQFIPQITTGLSTIRPEINWNLRRPIGSLLETGSFRKQTEIYWKKLVPFGKLNIYNLSIHYSTTFIVQFYRLFVVQLEAAEAAAKEAALSRAKLAKKGTIGGKR